MIILIADDENLVRIYLKKLIKDMQLPSVIILEAKNGKELVQSCQSYQPDLAFVDIKMPLLSGLDAIRQVKDRCPDTCWILLTGFSDFQYAVDAISLGVREYLLKPVEPEALTHIVQNVQEQLQKKRQDSNRYFELQVISRFNAYGLPSDGEDLLLAGDQIYTAFLFAEDQPFQSKDRSPLYQSFLPKLHQWLESWRTPSAQSALFCNQHGTLCLVLRSPASKADQVHGWLSRILRESSGKIPVSVFTCRTDQGLPPLIQQCEALQEDLSLAFLLEKGIVCEREALASLRLRPYALEFAALSANLTEAYQEKDEIRYQRCIEKLKQNSLSEALYLSCQKPILEHLCRALSVALPDGELPYDRFCSLLEDHAQTMYRQTPLAPSGLADRIKEYIQVNYANDVSIISLADTFNITPTYLSKVFREKTGEKLIDYISSVRIKNAKRLMCENPDILIKDVTLLVGYYSTRHFTNLFLKHEGMYPSEFQKGLKEWAALIRQY